MAALLFNKALFRQNLNRFWPLLAAYVFLIIIASSTLMMDLNLRQEISTAIFIDKVLNMSRFLTLVIAFFSIALAAAVYSYIHNSSATAMINALPYQRKTVYFSNYLSGLFMLLLPLLILLIALIGIGLNHNCLEWAKLFKWLFIFTSLSVLLYSLAVAIGMLTGHILAHMVFYGIANFLLIGLATLINQFLGYYLYGYGGMNNFIQGLVNKATPIVYASSLNRGMANVSVWVIYLLVGVLLGYLGLRLYEKRKMENSGDVIAIRKLNLLFKYGVTFCSSLTFGLILSEMFNVRGNFFWSMFLLLLLAAIGYFVAEMLLKKSYRVFASYRGLLVYALILIMVGFSIYNDWYHYAARMPDIDKVEAVAFANDGLSYNALNNLQADHNRVYIDGVFNLPDSLALTYGTPLAREENYAGSYRYIYKDVESLSPEEIRLLWSLIPGIYVEDESLADIYEFHTYLSQHIKEIRNNYRSRDISEWYNRQQGEVSHYNIKIIYRLDNGKTQTYNFPVLMPKPITDDLDQEVFDHLASLAGSAERRAKKIAAIDIPPAHIRNIFLDQSIMSYREKSSDKPFSMSTKENLGEIEIAMADYSSFIKALQADYLSMSDEEMLKLNYNNWAYARISIENPNLPPNNKFRDSSLGLDIDYHHTNCLEFLYTGGYINSELYELIQEQAQL